MHWSGCEGGCYRQEPCLGEGGDDDSENAQHHQFDAGLMPGPGSEQAEWRYKALLLCLGPAVQRAGVCVVSPEPLVTACPAPGGSLMGLQEQRMLLGVRVLFAFLVKHGDTCSWHKTC